MRARTTRENEGLVVPVEARDGLRVRQVGEALRTKTARLQDALVVPYYGTGVAHEASGPLHTVSTRDRFGVAFIAELRGGGCDARPVAEPLAMVTASDNHHMLVRHTTGRAELARARIPAGAPVGAVPAMEDCTFRMLEPRELQAAMAFHPSYRVHGTRREQVRQLGNGVTPPAAEWLIRAVARSLGATA
jgi:DNA (cytosine-5)-methyltransferase 1